MTSFVAPADVGSQHEKEGKTPALKHIQHQAQSHNEPSQIRVRQNLELGAVMTTYLMSSQV